MFSDRVLLNIKNIVIKVLNKAILRFAILLTRPDWAIETRLKNPIKNIKTNPKKTITYAALSRGLVKANKQPKTIKEPAVK